MSKQSKRSRPRGYSLFTTPSPMSIGLSDETNDSVRRRGGNELTLGSIDFIEGDESLRDFPDALKTQLQQYLQTSQGTTLTFAGKSKCTSLTATVDGRSACFVEMGTTKRLDAARYFCGPPVSRRHIVVVKPRPGSSFNAGEPAIIMFYGKGGNSVGRNIISRFAVWSPTGIRTDILVDRLLLTEQQAHEEDSSGLAPQKRRKTVKESKETQNKVNEQREHNNQDENEFGKTVTSQDPQTGPTIKQEMIERDLNLSTLQSDLSPSTPGIVPSLSTGTLQSPRQQSSRSSIRNSDASKFNIDPQPRPEYWNTTYDLRATPASAPGAQALLYFTDLNADQPTLIKSLAQCSTVQKLFAYARKAGISDEKTMLLSVSSNAAIVGVVRDDSQDYDEVLAMARTEQQTSGDNDSVILKVVPLQY